ncbi:TPA: hypothetical protein M2P32_004386 [Klebsiella pneumoniae]|nr:hypothetical protein [Klebsiella pneumoniae]
MTYDEAVTELVNGNKIAGRFSDDEYVTMSNGVMTLHSPISDIIDWTPSNSDRLSDDWYIV